MRIAVLGILVLLLAVVAYAATDVKPATPITSDNLGLALAQRLYTVNGQQMYPKTTYAPQLVLQCNPGDMAISGSCSAVPTRGGDIIPVQSSLFAALQNGQFQCRGPVYGATGDYSFVGTVVCLRKN